MKFPNFKSVLCLKGRLPARDFFENYAHLPLVCADGAIHSLVQRALTPTFLIGDLDSTIFQETPVTCTVLKRLDQNKTDFEKCLIEMDKRDLLPCLILGASGGEMDHALYNITCFMQASQRHHNMIFDVDEHGETKWVIALPKGAFEITHHLGKVLSILPYPEARLTTKGLEWDLENETLGLQTMSSVRNKIMVQQATITLHQGRALALVETAVLKKKNLRGAKNRK